MGIAPAEIGISTQADFIPTAPRRPSVPASDCAMVAASRRALELIAPKWRLEVLFLLSRGTRRHGELYRELGTVSKKVLTQTLRGLEADGLVARTVYPEVPTRVEYLLTQLGWSLTTPLLALADWGEQHQGDIDRSGPLRNVCGAAA